MTLAALVLVGFAALIAPMWLATSQMSLPASGWGAVIFMIIFCFGVGGTQASAQSRVATAE